MRRSNFAQQVVVNRLEDSIELGLARYRLLTPLLTGRLAGKTLVDP